jgi:hypothetical protein
MSFWNWFWIIYAAGAMVSIIDDIWNWKELQPHSTNGDGVNLSAVTSVTVRAALWWMWMAYWAYMKLRYASFPRANRKEVS